MSSAAQPGEERENSRLQAGVCHRLKWPGSVVQAEQFSPPRQELRKEGLSSPFGMLWPLSQTPVRSGSRPDMNELRLAEQIAQLEKQFGGKLPPIRKKRKCTN